LSVVNTLTVGFAKELLFAWITFATFLLLNLSIGFYDFQGLVGDPNVFWGLEMLGPGVLYSWGVWIGFFMAVVGGILGLVGGAIL